MTDTSSRGRVDADLPEGGAAGRRERGPHDDLADVQGQEAESVALADGSPGDEEPTAAEEHPSAGGGLWTGAWRELRSNPWFLLGSAILVLIVVMAAFPGLFTSIDANDRTTCDTSRVRQPPSADAWFGTDLFGCDYYSQVVYGARISVLIGLITVGGLVVLSLALGSLAGWAGGWVDALVSRFTDVWYGLPLILGAILLLSAFPQRNVWIVGGVLALLSWMTPMRLVRGGVLSTKEADYVQAARALGASRRRLLGKHVLPNSIAPLIVYSTISIGVAISAEAALSFLGIGLPLSEISWGVQLNQAQTYYRTVPTLVLFPSIFLTLTVLAFMLIGDALRDALDPKLK